MGPLPLATPPRELAVFAVVAGVTHRVAAFGYRGGSLFEQRDFSMAGTLVRNPQGNLLVDTGFGRHIDEQFPTLPWFLCVTTSYSLWQPAVDQLTARPTSQEVRGISVAPHPVQNRRLRYALFSTVSGSWQLERLQTLVLEHNQLGHNYSPMSSRDIVTAAVLWVSVLAWSIWVGGTIYQMLVVVPMWSAQLPESLEAFLKNTNYVRDILRFFGPRWMPVRSLALLLPFVGWNLRAHRPFFGVATCCFAAVILFTVAYVYPINAALFTEAVALRDANEVRALAHRWIIADRVRLLVGSVGYLALLRALSLPVVSR